MQVHKTGLDTSKEEMVIKSPGVMRSSHYHKHQLQFRRSLSSALKSLDDSNHDLQQEKPGRRVRHSIMALRQSIRCVDSMPAL